jgi:hypothetical protein
MPENNAKHYIINALNSFENADRKKDLVYKVVMPEIVGNFFIAESLAIKKGIYNEFEDRFKKSEEEAVQIFKEDEIYTETLIKMNILKLIRLSENGGFDGEKKVG